MQNLSESVAPPPLNIPASDQVVNLRVIDTAARVTGLPTAYFLDPRINGCDEFSGPSYSFLVEHEPSGTKVLFDLGISKSWESGAPRSRCLTNAIQGHFNIFTISGWIDPKAWI